MNEEIVEHGDGTFSLRSDTGYRSGLTYQEAQDILGRERMVRAEARARVTALAGEALGQQ
jgi:hypothetical protein